MATVKVKLRPSSVVGRPGCIVYQVTHSRVTRQITTNYNVFPSEWNEKQLKIVPLDDERRSVVQAVMQKMHRDMELLDRLIDKFDSLSGNYSSDDIVAEFRRMIKEDSLFNFMGKLIARFRQMNRVGTANNYNATINSFRRFRGDKDISISMLNRQLMEDYQDYLKSEGVTLNTISFYMRILRAVYNRAVSQGLTGDVQPFRTVYTGMEKTKKRAISVDDIKRISKLEFPSKPHLCFARDVFLFLFLCRGMSFIDAAYLKKTDVKHGVIIYRRHKTGQELRIKVIPPIRELIERYTLEKSPYLLPIITEPDVNERLQYGAALRRVNNGLKTIGKLIDLPDLLTTYVSRHTWATIAKCKNIPISVISDALGHDSVITTQIYLASMDMATIDEANDLIIGDLF
ncbi:MAG: site-specific integrase [Bacteroides sp.]|nr:site-specific integrase [Bacteroides sp.]